MKPVSILIIDDEISARELIKIYLQDYKDIEIVGEADNGLDAFKMIKNLIPQLIFLDIQMPMLTGLEMLELLDKTPEIIFSTAYEQFAIHAFEQNAVDYLLKPYSKERFDISIKRAIARINSAATEQPALTMLKETLNSRNEPLVRVAVKSRQQIHVFSVCDIKYIEAHGDYVKLHTAKGIFLKEKTMKFFEENLPQRQFIRIHRSSIVNLDEVAKIELYEKDNHIVRLNDGTVLHTSANGYKLLKSFVR